MTNQTSTIGILKDVAKISSTRDEHRFYLGCNQLYWRATLCWSLRLMTALRRTEKENTDYEKPEDRHPVTDLPTQKNETMQTPPCNLNICQKKNPQTPRIYKSSSLSLMWGSKRGECSRRFSALTWRRCRQQRHWQQRQQRRRRRQQELQHWRRRRQSYVPSSIYTSNG